MGHIRTYHRATGTWHDILFDDADLPTVELLWPLKIWHKATTSRFYVFGRGNSSRTRAALGRAIALPNDEGSVSYANGNPLDCRRSNLVVRDGDSRGRITRKKWMQKDADSAIAILASVHAPGSEPWHMELAALPSVLVRRDAAYAVRQGLPLAEALAPHLSPGEKKRAPGKYTVRLRADPKRRPPARQRLEMLAALEAKAGTPGGAKMRPADWSNAADGWPRLQRMLAKACSAGGYRAVREACCLMRDRLLSGERGASQVDKTKPAAT